MRVGGKAIVTKAFWQAKIWGLLHDPALKGLHASGQLGQEGVWQDGNGLPYLECMNGWVSPKSKYNHLRPNTNLSGVWLDHIGLCDLLSSASDRCTVGRLPFTTSVTYGDDGLQIRHLLSGEPYSLKLNDWHDNIKVGATGKTKFIQEREKIVIPEEIRRCTDARKVFWWFWRCFPEALAQYDAQIQLLPAETRIPDASLWSHTSLTAALAGSLAGYYKTEDEYPKKGDGFKGKESRPHVAVFSFTPVQELIKASRKLRDFWAGSWLLHYLSAKACWDLAWKYGPDTLLYPCLYAQPLIDYWLLDKYPEFKQWITFPSSRSLLTAGFPNVIVAILPNNAKGQEQEGNPIYAAMQMVKQSVGDSWSNLGDAVLDKLRERDRRNGEDDLSWREIWLNSWSGWLDSQWQTYWVAMPIGHPKFSLDCSPRTKNKDDKANQFNKISYDEWREIQNNFATPAENLFPEQEYKFLDAVFNHEPDLEDESVNSGKVDKKKFDKQPNMNVGSWWASLFEKTRKSLDAVKNARSWELPTAKAPRSSLSGLGSVVHPVFDSEHPEWASESETREFWKEGLGFFDKTEQMNATEVVKRLLHDVLPSELFKEYDQSQQWRRLFHLPDLSSGVAGWLKGLEISGDPDHKIAAFERTCQEIITKYEWTKEAAEEPWGIPWINQHYQKWQNKNPRLLNASWLVTDFADTDDKKDRLKQVKESIQKTFKEGNNPTDWYVIAAGDGDNMGNWLKGDKKLMQPYRAYIPDALPSKIDQLPQQLREPFQEFLGQTKRMSPSTHSALSRALLDFSNQLVPYLTEQRYAGRLIYGGGDDVLAYTNLWEWDQWLWDIRQCFRGSADPHGEFDNSGDYWRWASEESPIAKRPLFTMGSSATISFGIVIAHHSVPLAIALEEMWQAEEEAKKHEYLSGCSLKTRSGDIYNKKDSVQVRVIYGNGNILKSTCKFDTFALWQTLLAILNIEPAMFEQAATVWEQHPVPVNEAIDDWCVAFCDRREKLNDNKEEFRHALAQFIKDLWITTKEDSRDREVQNWLKLAAFILRKRDIKINL